MKYIILSLLLFSQFEANEIDRMESIVKDIENLRTKYQVCEQKLEDLESVSSESSKDTLEYLKQLQKELLTQKELVAEQKSINEELKKKNQMYLKKINSLEKSNEKSNYLIEKNDFIKKIQDKNNEIEKIKQKYEMTIENQLKKIKTLENDKKNFLRKSSASKKNICKDDNQFPKLMMKDDTSSHVKIQDPKTKDIEIVEEVQETPPSTYRLNKQSKIYNGVHGKELTTWEDKTSFTSRKLSQNWVNISGYFVERQWVKATVELWVERKNVTQR